MSDETTTESKAPRKSDFLGDVYGAWTVVAKAKPLEKGKRSWTVRNANGTERTVFQTDLSALAKEDLDAPLPAGSEHPDVRDMLAGLSDPFSLEPAELDQLAEVEEGAAPDLMEALAETFRVAAAERNADGKIPGNNKGEQVLAEDWAAKAVESMGGPKLDGPNQHRHPVTERGELGKLRSEDEVDPFAAAEPELYGDGPDDDTGEPAAFDLASFANSPAPEIVFSGGGAPAPLAVLSGDQPDPVRRAIKDLYVAVETAKLAVDACQHAADIVLKYVIAAG